VVYRVDAVAQTAAAVEVPPAGSPPHRRRPLLAVLLAAVAAMPSGRSGGALVEPDEREMRTAYVSFMHDSLASQGQLADPRCDLAKGCSVQLLDMRRDYRLVSFKKRGCRPSGDTMFVCRFEANITCVYLTEGKPDPQVQDLYCGPLYNKTSTYTALFHYQAPGWILYKFVQG
jgi:hypothetical protein